MVRKVPRNLGSSLFCDLYLLFYLFEASRAKAAATEAEGGSAARTAAGTRAGEGAQPGGQNGQETHEEQPAGQQGWPQRGRQA